MGSTIIAVDGINNKFKKNEVVRALAHKLKCNFELLNFERKFNSDEKIVYMRILNKMDYKDVIFIINNSQFKKGLNLRAYLPRTLSDVTLGVRKTTKIPCKIQRAMKIFEEDPKKVLKLVTEEMLTELQLKYPGLYEYNKRFSFIPIKEIKEIFYGRLCEISSSNKEASTSCFILSKAYRKLYPHTGDWAMIMDVLQMAHKRSGATLEDIKEKDLQVVPQVYVGADKSIEVEKADAVCSQYSKFITKSISEYVENLNIEKSSTDSQEEKAQKQVRREIKNMAPFLSQFVNEVVTQTLAPVKSNNPKHTITKTRLNMRVYGEPSLPTKDLMDPFLKKFGGSSILRGVRLYNLIWFNIPYNQYAKIMAVDRTTLGNSTVIIRPSDLPICGVVNKMAKGKLNPTLGNVKPVVLWPDQEQDEVEAWGDVTEGNVGDNWEEADDMAEEADGMAEEADGMAEEADGMAEEADKVEHEESKPGKEPWAVDTKGDSEDWAKDVE